MPTIQELLADREYIITDGAMGTVLFAAGLISYVRALETLPLGVAYPVLVGCSIVAISFVAIMFFGESISFAHVAGVVLIFLGIVILARSVNLA